MQQHRIMLAFNIYNLKVFILNLLKSHQSIKHNHNKRDKERACPLKNCEKSREGKQAVQVTKIKFTDVFS